MTREAMARAVGIAEVFAEQGSAYQATLKAAADELRKSCSTCWNYGADCPMGIEGTERMPSDGSGFCHEWQAKSPVPPANTEAVK